MVFEDPVAAAALPMLIVVPFPSGEGEDISIFECPARHFPLHRFFDLRSLCSVLTFFFVLFILLLLRLCRLFRSLQIFTPGWVAIFKLVVLTLLFTNLTKMLTPSLGFVLLVSASIAECRSLFDVKHFHGRYKRQNEDPTGLFLVASAVQSGSASDGSNNGVSAPGQSKSQTSQNNFINYCKGKTLTNGLQVQGGSCNGIRELIRPVIDDQC